MATALASASSVPIVVVTMPPLPKLGSRSPGAACAVWGEPKIKNNKNKMAENKLRVIRHPPDFDPWTHLLFMEDLTLLYLYCYLSIPFLPV